MSVFYLKMASVGRYTWEKLEITVPQQIVINDYICASNWNKHNVIYD